MARNHARLLTSIWANPEFRTLRSADQRLYMLAISQPNLNLCGVVPYTARRWARLAPDTTARDIAASVQRLVDSRFLLLDEDSEEVLVRSFVKHDGVLRSPNLIVSMSRDYAAIQSPMLAAAFIEGLPEGFVEGLQEGFLKGFAKPLPEGFWERLSEGFRKALPEHPLTCARGEKPLPLPHPLPPPGDEPQATQRAPLDEPEQPGGSAAEEDETKQEQPTGITSRTTRRGTGPHAASAAPTCEADVWARAAELDLERFVADGGAVRSRAGWLRTAAANRERDHGDDVEAWRAAGMDWPAVLARLVAETDPPEDRGRVIPTFEETQARIASVDAEAAETARLDAAIDALAEADRAALEAAAGEWARANWARGAPPAGMVRSRMRALVASSA